MLHIDYSSISRPGGRSINEDSACAIMLDGGGAVLALADGLGGHGGGQYASSAAAGTFVNAAARLYSGTHTGVPDPGAGNIQARPAAGYGAYSEVTEDRTDSEDYPSTLNPYDAGTGDTVLGYGGWGAAGNGYAAAEDTASSDVTLLSSAATEANRAVLSEQVTRNIRMMSTLVGLVISGKQAAWVHVGDSRLYCFKNGRMHLHTYDHSVPQMAVAMGMITEEQIRHHEDRSKILRALGSDTFSPDVSDSLDISRGYYAFLMCSDGFWEYVYEGEMEATLGISATAADWLERMEQLLLKRVPQDTDNYTAVAVLANCT